MRTIKFKVWDNVDYMSNPFTLQDLQKKKIQFTNDCKVLQFTGLTDKNGIEIFEGDIIKVQDYNGNWSRDGAEVVFSNDYVGGWVISNGNQNLNLGTRQIYLEIIGNIYENPELLNSSSIDVVEH